MPSGLPEDPKGKVRNAFSMSSVDTWSGWNRRLPRGFQKVLRFCGGAGCLPWRALNVFWLFGAGLSSQQRMRNATVKLPTSSLLATAAASLSSLVDCFAGLLSLELGGGMNTAPSHSANLLINTLERFLLAPPRSGLARIVAPNDRNCLQATRSEWLAIIFRNS